MKRSVTLIIIILFASKLFSQVDSSNYMVGNVLYEQENYTEAIKVYENVISKNGYSAEMNYNLGNAYYKTNQVGKSILNYERALKLNPTDGDIRYNLDLANLRIRDKFDVVDEVIFATWWRNIHQFFTTNMWAYISVFLIWLSIAGFAVYRFSENVRYQKPGFYAFIICFLLFIFSVSATFASDHYRRTHHYAIVMEPSSILKSEPNESSTNLTLLHEGLKVQVLDSEGSWTEVKLTNGYVGWLMSASVEEV